MRERIVGLREGERGGYGRGRERVRRWVRERRMEGEGGERLDEGEKGGSGRGREGEGR